MGRARNLKIGNNGFRTAWDDIDPIQMLPAEYRHQAVELIEANPNLIHVLERCKYAEIDCWEALDELFNAPGFPDEIVLKETTYA
jgi:hypothetical protein